MKNRSESWLGWDPLCQPGGLRVRRTDHPPCQLSLQFCHYTAKVVEEAGTAQSSLNGVSL